MGYHVHLCSFSAGLFNINSPSGKTGLYFDDSDQFGPSKVHPRTGDLTEISERLRWFWDWYPMWRAAAQPTNEVGISTPIGDILNAKQIEVRQHV